MNLTILGTSYKWNRTVFVCTYKAEGRVTEDEMVGWHHRLDRHETEQDLGAGDRQGSLVCFSPGCHKESDMTE